MKLKPYCPRGHAMTADNVTWQTSGTGGLFRQCRICNAARAKAWREANKDRLARPRWSSGQVLTPGV
jgi:hypothetical protein